MNVHKLHEKIKYLYTPIMEFCHNILILFTEETIQVQIERDSLSPSLEKQWK